LFRGIKHYLIVEQPLDLDWFLVLICGGASYQLWFVPALALWIVIFLFAGKWASQFENTRLIGSGFIIAGTFLLFCGNSIANSLPIVQDYSLFINSTIVYSGYFPIGMGLSCILEKRPLAQFVERLKSSHIIALICLIFLWPFACVAFPPVWFSAPVFSLALFTLFLVCNFSSKQEWIKALATYAFGIYLCHALFVEGLQMLFPVIGINLERFDTTFLLIVLAFAFSAIVCGLLGRLKLTRWLVV